MMFRGSNCGEAATRNTPIVAFKEQMNTWTKRVSFEDACDPDTLAFAGRSARRPAGSVVSGCRRSLAIRRTSAYKAASGIFFVSLLFLLPSGRTAHVYGRSFHTAC